MSSADFPPPQQPAGQNPYAQPVPPAGNPYAAAPQGGAAQGAAPQGAPMAGNPYAAAQPGAPAAPRQGAPMAGNPFAAQQPQGAPGVPYGQPAPAGPGFAYAPAPVAPARGNPALGIALGVVAMVVCALLYGLLIKGTKHEIGYAALAVGALVGFTVGKLGGRNKALPLVALVLAVLGVYFGQVYGITLLAASAPGMPGTANLLVHHYGAVQHAWKESMDAKSVIFLLIAAVEGFVFTRRVAS